MLLWCHSLHLHVTAVWMHLASHRGIRAGSGLWIQKYQLGWVFPGSNTNMDCLNFLLSFSPSHIPLLVARSTWGIYMVYMTYSQRSMTQSNHHHPCSYSKCMFHFHIFAKLLQGPSILEESWDSFSHVLRSTPYSWQCILPLPTLCGSIPLTQLTQEIKPRSKGNNFSPLLTPTTSQMVILWCFRTYYWHPDCAALLKRLCASLRR